MKKTQKKKHAQTVIFDNEMNMSQVSNPLSGYKYLIFFSMLYMSIMICNAILTNRYVSLSKDI